MTHEETAAGIELVAGFVHAYVRCSCGKRFFHPAGRIAGFAPPMNAAALVGAREKHHRHRVNAVTDD